MHALGGQVIQASMKCSSRRNCNPTEALVLGELARASMKCSSRRNCNRAGAGGLLVG